MNTTRPSSAPAPIRSTVRPPPQKRTRLGGEIEQHNEVTHPQLRLRKLKSDPDLTLLDKQERLKTTWQVELGKLLAKGGIHVDTVTETSNGKVDTWVRVRYIKDSRFPHVLRNCNIKPEINKKVPTKTLQFFRGTKSVRSTWSGETIEIAVYRALMGIAFDCKSHLEEEIQKLSNQLEKLTNKETRAGTGVKKDSNNIPLIYGTHTEKDDIRSMLQSLRLRKNSVERCTKRYQLASIEHGNSVTLWGTSTGFIFDLNCIDNKGRRKLMP